MLPFGDVIMFIRLLVWCNCCNRFIRKGSPIAMCGPWINLLMLEPKYSGITRSLPQLLMPWLIASPGQQQPCKDHCVLRLNISTCVLPAWGNDRKRKRDPIRSLKQFTDVGVNFYVSYLLRYLKMFIRGQARYLWTMNEPGYNLSSDAEGKQPYLICTFPYLIHVHPAFR